MKELYNNLTKKQKKTAVRVLVSAAALAALHFVPLSGWPKLLLYAADYALIGYDVVRKAFLGLVRGRVLDENLLMTAATLGALALAVYSGSYDGTEAVAVMLFYQLGELFQSIAVGRSRRSISALMDIRPDHVSLVTPDGLRTVDPQTVEAGSLIAVNPGERVPLDGVITEGSSALDTAALTGESRPRRVSAGDEVLSGCVNLTGVLTLRTTKSCGESTVSRILDLIENASARKSRSEAFISRFSRIYTPVVCGCALALAVLPPLIGLWMTGTRPAFDVWVYRALTFLVISCPCALVVSVPLTFFCGLGAAGKAGILIKGSSCMETLSKVDTVIFDKTGTLTEGVFEVAGVYSAAMSDEQVLAYAALAEYASPHPIAASLRRAYGREIDRDRVTDVTEWSGQGVTAVVDGVQAAVGNERLMARSGIDCVPCREPGTIVHVAVDGRYAGHILISDRVKENAAPAVAALRRVGVRRTIMLTGDNEAAAAFVSRTLGLDEYHAGLLPGDKVDTAEAIMRTSAGKTAFVGDGLNDAPVLTRADVGIAMGALGSDAAIEAADVVLTDDDPMKLAAAVHVSRKAMRIVYENVVFTLSVKLACLLLGALGLADMGLAVFADVGVMVLAVLNAVRVMILRR